MDIELVAFERDFTDKALYLIAGFWMAHSQAQTSREEAMGDLTSWTATGHQFYFIRWNGEMIGFAHMGSRGAGIDWLEDLFVLPEHQGKGIGSKAIALLEKQVKQTSESLYIEVAARNLKAMGLYHRLGYRCLNTVTLRKDFVEDDFIAISQEKIAGLDFEIRKRKQ